MIQRHSTFRRPLLLRVRAWFLFALACPATAGGTTIMEIQGPGHTSPYARAAVVTTGIVTATTRNGFYLQDPTGDGSVTTSDGIFVFTSISPTVSVGDRVEVSGTVQEYLPGGSSDNLTITEIVGPSVITISTGHRLPAATVLGSGGRVPPTSIIDDDALTIFDPQDDGIDFFETLEGMMVLLPNPRVVGPTNPFGEIFVVVDGASGINARGGITIDRFDFNPERIQIDDALYDAAPAVEVGDVLADVQGPVTYSFGNYEVTPTVPPKVVVRGNRTRETTSLIGDDSHMTVATFNVEGLDPRDGARLDDIAGIVVRHLLTPDIIGVQEIQDNNGPINDGTVDASTTFMALIDAIQSACGSTYEYRSISPVDNQDGGELGGNIRVGFLYNPNRARFIDRGSAGPNDPIQVLNGALGPELALSPGRIDPLNAAFVDSRKPLAAEFEFGGEKVFVVVCHFTSRSGSDPLFGAVQPPAIAGESQRFLQADVVHSFVRDVLALDSNANVVLLGDFNDFKFSRALRVLVGTPPILMDPARALPVAECYSFVFEGNSQALDHIFLSPSLAGEVDFVHVAAEYATRTSDHDPVVARVRVVDEPVASALHTDLHVHPNPFNSTVTIAYTLRSKSAATVRVYDVCGRMVATLVDDAKGAGGNMITWDGRDRSGRPAASGVYFVRLQTDGEAVARKAVLLR